MHILLIAVHPDITPQSVPLANAFLKSYQQCHAPAGTALTIGIEEYVLQQAVSTAATDILTRNPAAVGFSMYAWNRQYCLDAARILRSGKPDIILFAGGPEASADPETLLQTGAFDFLICGEGEQPFAEVCCKLAEQSPVAGVPGVATLDDRGKIHHTPSVPLRDLDQIPSPWLQGTLDVSACSGVLWQLSRGCGFSCDFCFDSRDRHGVRRFSLERIEDELRYFASSGVSQIFVLDSTFNQDSERAKKIVRMIRKLAPQIHFHFEVRSEFIDRELAELFARITSSLQIGLQSANPDVLKRVGRSFRRDDFVKRVMLLNHSGATFGFDLIYGLPGESLASFCSSLDFALGLYPNHLDIFPLAILPGTALAARADSIGLVHHSAPPYTVTATPDMGRDDFLAARNIANACDIFYTRGKAVAWFLGVLEPLGIAPAVFFQRFSEWLAQESGAQLRETDLDDASIWQLQRTYVCLLFSDKRLARYLPTVLDLVDYHYHYAACIVTPIPPAPARKIRPDQFLETCFQRALSARLATFNHEIMDLIDAGVVDIRRFASHFPRSGSFSVIYPTKSGVATDSIDEVYFRILESLDGKTPLAEILKKHHLSAADTSDFMQFAVAERIVVAAESIAPC